MRIETIFLDMDGVCCNFVKGACEAMYADYDKILETWPAGEYDVTKVLKCTAKEMWVAIDAGGKSFWQDLEEYSWFRDLYNMLMDVAPVYFLTSPADDPYCAAGKLAWLQNRLGRKFKGYVLTCNKHLLSRENTLLIDDSSVQCERFSNGGPGISILFPQPWNEGVLSVENDPVMHISDTIHKLVR